MTSDPSPALTLLAPAEAAGARLDKWLADAGTGMSRSRLRVLIEEGRVTANGQPAKDASAKVIAGAAYTIDLPAPVSALPEAEDIPLDIVFEDKHLIVINKPPGLVVHPAGGSERGTLVNALLFHCGPELTGIGGVARPGIVHRLDKDTSGVMVAAKSEAAHTALTAMFAAHDIERAYLAVTRGAPRPLVGRIETNIGRSPNDRKKMAVMKEKHFRADHWSDDSSQENDLPQGKIAITNYRALETFGRLDETGTQPAAALVECRLETGRTHQIRVHLQSIGFPLVGDAVYGKQHLAHLFPRQALHAERLALAHPADGEPCEWQAPVPADFDALLQRAGIRP